MFVLPDEPLKSILTFPVASDYIVASTRVTFNSNSAGQACTVLTINNDDDFEGVESLTVSITRADNTLAIDPAKNMATINILDLDGE